MESIKKLIRELNISDSVIFLTDLSIKSLIDSALHDLYSLCDLIFYFSKSENFGLPLIEAGLAKTPIFLSNLEVFHEIGKGNVNYIDYNATNPEEAARIISKFINENQTLQANKTAKQQFNLKTILEEKLLPLL
jgi:glycosyltransferase involved in cell wall biosynthesis